MTLAAVLAVTTGAPTSAVADGAKRPKVSTSTGSDLKVEAKKVTPGRSGQQSGSSNGGNGISGGATPYRPTYTEAQIVAFLTLWSRFAGYNASYQPSQGFAVCPPTDGCQTNLNSPFGANGGGVAPATLTPQELAQRAAAKLNVSAPAVGAGPTTEDNGLIIDTAVGYPVWLWSEGNTAPVSASDSDGDLTVNITASIAKVVYSMGDGTTLTCGTGTKWTKAQAGEESPDCGHIYQEMGRYTITTTTTWDANWSAAGESGTVPLTQTASRSYRVGEIQALIRKR